MGQIVSTFECKFKEKLPDNLHGLLQLTTFVRVLDRDTAINAGFVGFCIQKGGIYVVTSFASNGYSLHFIQGGRVCMGRKGEGLCFVTPSTYMQ